MEHQSSVTYGNWFRNGYLQRDPCGCGVGFKFDFIIVHESAHEWFGNNISMKDAADMWIHEGFANYSENLFVEYHFGKKDAKITWLALVAASETTVRSSAPMARTGKGQATCIPKAETCCTPFATSSTTTRNGSRSSVGSTLISGTRPLPLNRLSRTLQRRPASISANIRPVPAHDEHSLVEVRSKRKVRDVSL